MPLPVGAVVLMSAGTVIKSYARNKDRMAEAGQERMNAAFYREQAAFAEMTGERTRMLFDRESVVLFGDQQSGFAKAGIDTGSAEFMAREMLYRSQESDAIQKEADMNVKLANLRAQASEEAASNLEKGSGYETLGDVISLGTAYFGS